MVVADFRRGPLPGRRVLQIRFELGVAASDELAVVILRRNADHAHFTLDALAKTWRRDTEEKR